MGSSLSNLAALAVLAVIWAVWIIPLHRILGRLGFAQGWAFVALFPPAGMALLWVLAFRRWRIAEAYEGPAIPIRT